MAYADQSNRPKTKTIMANLLNTIDPANTIVRGPDVSPLHFTKPRFYIEQCNFPFSNGISFYAWGDPAYIDPTPDTVALFIVTPKPKLPAGTPTDDEGQERKGGYNG